VPKCPLYLPRHAGWGRVGGGGGYKASSFQAQEVGRLSASPSSPSDPHGWSFTPPRPPHPHHQPQPGPRQAGCPPLSRPRPPAHVHLHLPRLAQQQRVEGVHLRVQQQHRAGAEAGAEAPACPCLPRSSPPAPAPTSLSTSSAQARRPPWCHPGAQVREATNLQAGRRQRVPHAPVRSQHLGLGPPVVEDVPRLHRLGDLKAGAAGSRRQRPGIAPGGMCAVAEPVPASVPLRTATAGQPAGRQAKRLRSSL
jgi:hypothetical protein